MLARGMKLYHPYCSNCHGDAAISGSFIPDLTRSPAIANDAMWKNIVLGGERTARGMVNFSDELSADDVEAIRAYVVHRAHQMQAQGY